MRQGAQGWCYWDDPEGWEGEGGGRVVQDGGHMLADSSECMAKTTTIF